MILRRFKSRPLVASFFKLRSYEKILKGNTISKSRELLVFCNRRRFVSDIDKLLKHIYSIVKDDQVIIKKVWFEKSMNKNLYNRRSKAKGNISFNKAAISKLVIEL